MKKLRSRCAIPMLFAGMLILTACSEEITPAAGPTDTELLAQVTALLGRQTDLPPALEVSVSAGVVTIGGSLECEECAGWETPGNAGSVQQSIGAVVRAVPGVFEVQFAFAGPP